MCEERMVRGDVKCPFTLAGIAELERRLGSKAYQPVAQACHFPTHPSCPSRCGEVPVKCHHRPFKLFRGLVEHAATRRRVDEEDDDVDGELHLTDAAPSSGRHPPRPQVGHP